MEFQKPIELKIEEINAAEPAVEWIETADRKYANVLISLPHDAFISAVANYEQGMIFINDFSVPKDLQKSGIGSRLLKKLVELARQHSLKKISGNVRSVGGLKAFAKIMGENNVSLHPANKPVSQHPDNSELSFSEVLEEGEKGDSYINYDIVANL